MDSIKHYIHRHNKECLKTSSSSNGNFKGKQNVKNVKNTKLDFLINQSLTFFFQREKMTVLNFIKKDPIWCDTEIEKIDVYIQLCAWIKNFDYLFRFRSIMTYELVEGVSLALKVVKMLNEKCMNVEKMKHCEIYVDDFHDRKGKMYQLPNVE
jgi:hypothetical protein